MCTCYSGHSHLYITTREEREGEERPRIKNNMKEKT